ncbi:hypothetical protein [Candidatus Uabimicrobium sp. HlEnr_7]|uniref:hypothetical protein n=1 Tax=Candidatus Uabimicrobium helgolandensis TaxID=3095367 RepID=UPI0035572CA2
MLANIIRWGFVTINLCVLLVLFFHKSHEPQVFSRYSYNYFTLLCIEAINIIVISWIFINKKRYQIFYQRLLTYQVIPIAITITALLLVTDCFIDLMIVPAPILLLFFVIFALVFLASHHPRKVITKITLAATTIVVSIALTEVVFNTFLLTSKIPENEKSFEREISSSWPQKISPNKPKNTLRILGLCDSFGRAGGHKNYHYLLQNLFAKENKKVEIINFSVGGYEPLHQLYILQKFAAKYQPDIVVHGFFVGNDFANPDTNTSQFAEISVRKRSGIMKFRPHYWGLSQWLRNYYKTRKNVINNKKMFKKNTFLTIEYQRLQICRPFPPPKIKWSETIAIIDKIRKHTQNIRAKYIMVIHPDQFQSDRVLQSQLQTKYEIKWQDYQLKLPQKFLSVYCQKNDIQYLDLLPYFESNNKELYLQQNTHYNAEGNQIAAEKIYEFLREYLKTTNKKSGIK